MSAVGVRRTLALSTSVLATSVVVLAGSPVGAATDTSPPTWSKIPAASLALGAVLDSWVCDSDEDAQYSVGPVYVDYQARDPQSGIDHYDVATNQGVGPEDVGLQTRATMTARTTDPADCEGGGRPIFSASAVNGAGLSGTEYAWNSSQLTVVQDAGAGVTYTGTWQTSSCACWSGGTTHKTTKKGSAVRAALSVPASLGTPATSSLGLVMAKGPDRGRAEVWLDGVKVATVDTHSTTKVNRTVVWRGTVTPGSHTLRVVNLATQGHPRIDVDALVLLPKGSRTFN